MVQSSGSKTAFQRVSLRLPQIETDRSLRYCLFLLHIGICLFIECFNQIDSNHTGLRKIISGMLLFFSKITGK